MAEHFDWIYLFVNQPNKTDLTFFGEDLRLPAALN